jgi:hypothetical protein
MVTWGGENENVVAGLMRMKKMNEFGRGFGFG